MGTSLLTALGEEVRDLMSPGPSFKWSHVTVLFIAFDSNSHVPVNWEQCYVARVT